MSAQVKQEPDSKIIRDCLQEKARNIYQRCAASSVETHLVSKARPGIHDQGPEFSAASHTTDEQSIFVTALYVLFNTSVGHIVMVALLHWPMSVVHSNPLRRRESQTDL